MWLSGNHKLICTHRSSTVTLASFNTMHIGNEEKEGRPLSVRIIDYVDRALEALGIVFRANSSAVEGIPDRNGHRRKEVGEGESISWGVEQTKGEGRE